MLRGDVSVTRAGVDLCVIYSSATLAVKNTDSVLTDPVSVRQDGTADTAHWRAAEMDVGDMETVAWVKEDSGPAGVRTVGGEIRAAGNRRPSVRTR